MRAAHDPAEKRISEKLLRCREAHEFISYSEWDTEADIELYGNSTRREKALHLKQAF
jgi:hypothetical protein